MNDKEKEIFVRLEKLYSKMDIAWNKIALLYGFECNGCNENCCETEFYHHTLVEKNYLLKGFKQLSAPSIIFAKKWAKKVCTKRDLAAKKGESIRIICPLNLDGKCILYKFRPMICRLHGIPHQLRKPDSLTLFSPGCNAGAHLFDAKGYIEFDRTPFYIEMAAIEKEYLTSIIGKITRNRQTVAQMLLKF